MIREDGVKGEGFYSNFHRQNTVHCRCKRYDQLLTAKSLVDQRYISVPVSGVKLAC